MMKIRSVILLLLLLTGLLHAEEQSLEMTLAGKRVIFLGESHDSATDHAGQLQALQVFHVILHRPVILAAEMFNESGAKQLEEHQALDSFVDFSPSFWKEQWGHDYKFYKAIWEFAKTSDMKVHWLRPNPKLTKSVRANGPMVCLEKIDSFLLGPQAYRKNLEEIARQHLPDPSAELPPKMMDSFFLIQCFWDEFMAWRIAELAKAHPESVVVVLVGHGHLDPGFGIPARLKRRAPELEAIRIGFQDEDTWTPDIIIKAP